MVVLTEVVVIRRTSQGVRGLKQYVFGGIAGAARRTSQGVRGLKHHSKGAVGNSRMSHLARGAWIETGKGSISPLRNPVAPRKGCVD